MTIRLKWLWLALVLAPVLSTRGADPYEQLAEQLTALLGTTNLPVGMGNFPYQDTEQLSKFSELIRERLAAALVNSGKIRLVLPSQIAVLQREGMFQGPVPLDPGLPLQPVKSPQLTALVRGRYYVKDTSVIVKPELLLLESGKVLPGTPFSLGDQRGISADWLIADELMPLNFEASQKNIQDVAARSQGMRHDFPIELAVKQARRDFTEGDSEAYYIRPKVGCFVAVFDHQVDGSSVLLFPNAYELDTFMPPQVFNEIPRANTNGFFLRIAEPFGADVIQIIACTRNSPLHREMARLAQETPKRIALATVPREVIADAISNAKLSTTDGDGQPQAQWSEARLVICTRPKPRR
jgi:hypothetical protein